MIAMRSHGSAVSAMSREPAITATTGEPRGLHGDDDQRTEPERQPGSLHAFGDR